MAFLFRWRNPLTIVGLLFLIFGLRLSEGIRFVTPLPQGDDYRLLYWLQHFSEGVHHWGFIWERSNGHLFVLYYLINLFQYGLNGYWDARIDFITYALIHTLEAAVCLWAFGKLLPRRDRWWLYGFIFLLFATPFGGYRIAWGNLYTYTNVVVFGIPAIYCAIHTEGRWRMVALTLILAALGSVNIAAGCLSSVAIAMILGLRAATQRRIGAQDVVIVAVTFLIFVVCFGTMHTTARAVGVFEALNAFFKAMAWPVVFTPLAGVATLVPLAGLGAWYVFASPARNRNVEFIIAMGVFACLLALATGAFRGDNANFGMPSGRYVDLFLIVPLTALAALVLLCRGTNGSWRQAWTVYAWLWCGLQVLGFSVHILYRTIPFIGNQTGEWVEPAKLSSFREDARHPDRPMYLDSPLFDESLDVAGPPESADLVHGVQKFPAMTLPMITGFPLLPAKGNYVANGYALSYAARPGENYVGSFDPANRRTPKTYTSPAFTPTAPYILLDVLVDKKARFTNYRLQGLDLALVDQTANGARLELLPQLAHAFPFLFRDWESVYAPVTPGHTYVIESSASDATPTDWLAFSEPVESGRLTPLTTAISQSGKLISILALGLLVFCAGLHRDYFGLFGGDAEADEELTSGKRRAQ